MIALGATKVKRQTTIMDKTTLLDKGTHILDPDRFMWIQIKHNYDKHVERLENWKDITQEEKWANKTIFVSLFYEVGSINSKYNARILKHLYHQRHKYLFWLSK
jgi:hypothetical protein